jgi:hypothetical protein
MYRHSHGLGHIQAGFVVHVFVQQGQAEKVKRRVLVRRGASTRPREGSGACLIQVSTTVRLHGLEQNQRGPQPPVKFLPQRISGRQAQAPPRGVRHGGRVEQLIGLCRASRPQRLSRVGLHAKLPLRMPFQPARLEPADMA